MSCVRTQKFIGTIQAKYESQSVLKYLKFDKYGLRLNVAYLFLFNVWVDSNIEDP